MDPLTAICNLANAALTLAGKVVDKQPPEVAAKLWEMYLEDVKEWRAFWAKINLTPNK